MNYLNTGNAFTLFKKAVTGGIYVDKSMLIDKISAKIGTNSQYICITRPRRFGKSMNLHMLGAYYTKGRTAVFCSTGMEFPKRRAMKSIATVITSFILISAGCLITAGVIRTLLMR